MGSDSIIGALCQVADKTSIKRSTIGNHTTVKEKVKVTNSIIMHGVTIEEGWEHTQGSIQNTCMHLLMAGMSTYFCVSGCRKFSLKNNFTFKASWWITICHSSFCLVLSHYMHMMWGKLLEFNKQRFHNQTTCHQETPEMHIFYLHSKHNTFYTSSQYSLMNLLFFPFFCFHFVFHT